MVKSALAAGAAASQLLSCPLRADAVLPIVCIGAMLSFLCGVGIGGNDLSANFAMVVGSGSLNMRQAIITCAVFELLGAAFMGAKVSDTIRNGIVEAALFEKNPELIIGGMMCATLAAALWLFASTAYGLPVSITHTVVGSVMGFAIFATGMTLQYVKGSGLLKILVSWVLAPVGASIVTGVIFYWLRKHVMLQPNAQHLALKSLPFCMGLSLIVNVCFVFIEQPPVLLTVNENIPFSAQVIIAVSVVVLACWWAGNHIFPAMNRKANMQTQFVWEAATIKTTFAATPNSSTVTSSSSTGAAAEDAPPLAAPQSPMRRLNSAKLMQKNLQFVDRPQQMPRISPTELRTQVSERAIYRVTSFAATDSKLFDALGPTSVRVEPTTPLLQHKVRSQDHELRSPSGSMRRRAIKRREAVKAANTATATADGGYDHIDGGGGGGGAQRNVSFAGFGDHVLSDAESEQSLGASAPRETDEQGPSHVSNYHYHYPPELVPVSAVDGAPTPAASPAKKVDVVVAKRPGTAADAASSSSESDSDSDPESPTSGLCHFHPRAEYLFVSLQVLAGAMSSFVHGAVAGANATAPFMVLYDTYARAYLHVRDPDTTWIMAIAMLGIAAGMWSLGSKLVKTVGVELVTVTPARGWAMQVGGTIVTMLCTGSGIPVSLSQCQVGAAIGCGIVDAHGRTDLVSWSVVTRIVAGWLVTIVIGAATTGVSMHLLSMLMCG